LRAAGVPFRLCSNTSTRSTASMLSRLVKLGFVVSPNEIFTPIPAARSFLNENNLRPYILLDPGRLSFVHYNLNHYQFIIYGIKFMISNNK